MQTGSAASTASTESGSSNRAASVSCSSTRILVKTAQTICAAISAGSLVIVLNHRKCFSLREFQQHIRNNICFQTVDVIQRSGTDWELHIQVLQNQLPDVCVFGSRCAVVLDSITPCSTSVAGFCSELIRRTIGCNLTRDFAHWVCKTQRCKHWIISGATTLIIAAAGQCRCFLHVCIVFASIFKQFDFLFHTGIGFVKLCQFFFDATINVNLNALVGANDFRRTNLCNLCFQRRNLFGKLCFGSFNGSGNFSQLFSDHSFGFFFQIRFNRIELFNDFIHDNP